MSNLGNGIAAQSYTKLLTVWSYLWLTEKQYPLSSMVLTSRKVCLGLQPKSSQITDIQQEQNSQRNFVQLFSISGRIALNIWQLILFSAVLGEL